MCGCCCQVLATKDDEAIKLRSTVDGLRAVLAEKDSVSNRQEEDAAGNLNLVKKAQAAGLSWVGLAHACAVKMLFWAHAFNKPARHVCLCACVQLFSQFQAQVQELELIRVQESEQRLATEQLLAAKQKEWAQQLEAGQQGK